MEPEGGTGEEEEAHEGGEEGEGLREDSRPHNCLIRVKYDGAPVSGRR